MVSKVAAAAVVEAMEGEVEAGGEDMEEGVSTEVVAGRAGGTMRVDHDIADDLFSQGRWL